MHVFLNILDTVRTYCGGTGDKSPTLRGGKLVLMPLRRILLGIKGYPWTPGHLSENFDTAP